jgi:hypothetical protein
MGSFQWHVIHTKVYEKRSVSVYDMDVRNGNRGQTDRQTWTPKKGLCSNCD